MPATFKIGVLAERTGLTRDAIRFYERSGLLPPAERTPAGYRLYTGRDAGRLRFIKEAQALGLTLDDVRELFSASQLATPEECRQVAELLARRIQQVDQRLAALTRFRERLAESQRLCSQADRESCPVVLDLESAARDPLARRRSRDLT